MSFDNDLKKHLADYKKRKFPNLPNGYWMSSKPPKELNYAFQKKDKNYNLIHYYKSDFLSEISGINMHMYFHHLNSSQAMCINFFYPLFKENQLELITQYLGFKDEKVDYSTVKFEKESEIDGVNNRRATNFDFYFKTISGEKFFFEIKYTEQDFGRAKADMEHIEKFENVYEEQLKHIESPYDRLDVFLKNYQIIRNLIHVKEDSFVIFLYPKENIKIRKGAAKAKTEILKSEYKKYFLDKHWDDIFKFVNTRISNPKIKNQMDEFGEKYFIS